MKTSIKYLPIAIVGCLFFLGACTNDLNSGGKHIRLGDESMIVTETDTNNLKNYTRDISQTEQDEGEIARIMVQVDSIKVSEELATFTASDSTLNGFSVEFAKCKVVFDGLGAKELTAQNPETNRSVSYMVTSGDLAKMKLKVIGLKEVAIKERIYTKLKVANGDEEYLLKSLGRKISNWFPLAGKENVFIALGDNSFQFNDLSNAKLREALKKELLAKKKNQSEINEWMQRVKNTNDYTDAPCKLYVATAQFRISGKNEKGAVNKLIQFDIVE